MKKHSITGIHPHFRYVIILIVFTYLFMNTGCTVVGYVAGYHQDHLVEEQTHVNLEYDRKPVLPGSKVQINFKNGSIWEETIVRIDYEKREVIIKERKSWDKNRPLVRAISFDDISFVTIVYKTTAARWSLTILGILIDIAVYTGYKIYVNGLAAMGNSS